MSPTAVSTVALGGLHHCDAGMTPDASQRPRMVELRSTESRGRAGVQRQWSVRLGGSSLGPGPSSARRGSLSRLVAAHATSAVVGSLGGLYAGLVAFVVTRAPDIVLFDVEWGVPTTFAGAALVLVASIGVLSWHLQDVTDDLCEAAVVRLSET